MSVSRLLAEVRERLTSLLRGAHQDAELEEELSFHVEMETDKHVRAGMSPADAHRLARRRLGALERCTEDVRDARGIRLLSELRADLRYALRSLRRAPAFTVVAVLAMGLAVGATTAIFTVVDRVLIRPLPYADADRLVTVWTTYPSWRDRDAVSGFWDRIPLSYPEYLDWQDAQTSFEAVGVYGGQQMSLTSSGDPREVWVGTASTSLFALLGMPPELGRSFLVGEEGTRAPKLAILTSELWRSRYGADPRVLERSIVLDGEPYSIVGVLPPGFRLRYLGPFAPAAVPELWIPIGSSGDASLGRGDHQFNAIGRIRSDMSLDQATAEAALIFRAGRSPETQGAHVLPRQVEETRGARRPLLLLLGSVFLLLTIGCGNVVTLLLAEAARRRHELATRAALGAGRGRLVRQLMTEGVVLGLLGAALGALVAYWAGGVLLRLAPAGVWLPERMGMDLRVLLFCATLGLLTGLVCGLMSAVASTHTDLGMTLSRASRGVASSSWRTQQAVLVVELALSFVLLVTAGLLARSLAATFRVAPGFTTERLSVARLALPPTRYGSDGEARAFFDRAMARVAAVPGVSAASGSSALPFTGVHGSSSFEVEGRVLGSGDERPEAIRRTVMPGFHELLGIPLLAGRGVSPADDALAPGVVVVSAAWARRWFPGESPLGRRIIRDSRSWAIVGVVGDVLRSDLRADVEPTFYVPFAQQPLQAMDLIVQSSLPAASLTEPLREAIWSLDPALPVPDLRAMRDLVDATTAEHRYRTVLVAAFGAAAALLAAFGIFAVTLRLVAARTRELGVRTALGATRRQLATLVARRLSGPLALGVGSGVVVTGLTAGALQGFLFEVGPFDALTYTGVTLLLGGASLVAAYVPARRAARLDPVEALRLE